MVFAWLSLLIACKQNSYTTRGVYYNIWNFMQCSFIHSKLGCDFMCPNER